jgi:hypothetical protein
MPVGDVAWSVAIFAGLSAVRATLSKAQATLTKAQVTRGTAAA